MRFSLVFALILALSLLSGCGSDKPQTAFEAFGVEQTGIPQYEVADLLTNTPELLHVQIKGNKWTLEQCKQVLADFIEKNRDKHSAIYARIFGNYETGSVMAFYFTDEKGEKPFKFLSSDRMEKIRIPEEGYPAFGLEYPKE